MSVDEQATVHNVLSPSSPVYSSTWNLKDLIEGSVSYTATFIHAKTYLAIVTIPRPDITAYKQKCVQKTKAFPYILHGIILRG